MPGLVVHEPIVQTPLTASLGDAINFRTHFRRGQERIAAAIHRRAARMRRLSAKCNRVSLHPERSENSSKRKIEIEKHRALFDVQLEIRRGVLQFFAGIFYFLEIDSVFFQRIDQANSVLVLEPARFVHVDLARAGRRTEKTFSEPRAFFIGPIDQSNCDRRLAFVLRIDAPRRISTPAIVFKQPSSQPPFGTESICPPMRRALFDFTG